MPEQDIGLDTLREIAKRAGLEVSDAELEEVKPGVLRNLAMAKVVRKWAESNVEPATAQTQPES